MLKIINFIQKFNEKILAYYAFFKQVITKRIKINIKNKTENNLLKIKENFYKWVYINHV